MSAARLAWLARHEARLAWRDAVAMLGGHRLRVPVAVLAFEVVAHAVAFEAIAPKAGALLHPDKAMLMTLTGALVLAGALFLSQAMETTTRGFYARADLDLLLCSPTSPRQIFAVRIGAIAATTVATAVLIAAPAVDALALLGGPRMLLAFGVLVATGTAAAALAVWITAMLFRFVGPKRTRLVAQIAAAVIGAGCVVGVQAAAIAEGGSRFALFSRPAFVAAAPALDSPLWWPARAALGDGAALAAVVAFAAALLAATMAGAAGAFAGSAPIVAGLGERAPALPGRGAFTVRRPAAALRAKELTLLRRDPWLVSQSLMQVLYLVPPALMLWHGYGAGGPAVLVPVLVMAAGQLAGGLAWLAISGEDVPDLVGTAPITPAAILRAKIEAVALAVALPMAPLVIATALLAPLAGVAAGVGSALAAAGASTVQYIFRVRGQRSNFRRRQTSSRIATFAEALLSISVAAAAGLAAAGLWLAAVPMLAAGGVLLAARALAPPAG